MEFQNDDDLDVENELDLSLLTQSPSPPPDCPMCGDPMKWIDGAYLCIDCNGMECGPETG